MDPLTVIGRHYAAATKGDLAGMFADFAPDGVFIERTLPAPGTYVGAKAVIETVFPALAAVYDDFRFVLDQLLGNGETVIALGWYEARLTRNGQPVRIRVCHVWTVDQGRITRFEQIADTLAVFQALQP